jgi:hypothetical protein
MEERRHLPAQTEAEVRLSTKRSPVSITRLLQEAGFESAEVAEMPVAYRFADAEELWFFVSELRGPVALALEELGEEERGVVRAEIERRADRVAGGFELTGVSLNVVAS